MSTTTEVGMPTYKELVALSQRYKRVKNLMYTIEVWEIGKAFGTAIDALNEGDPATCRQAFDALDDIINGHEITYLWRSNPLGPGLNHEHVLWTGWRSGPVTGPARIES